MMPTSISQILEQVFNAAVSLLAAWGFINVFADGTENSIAKWGAAGSTVGTGAGVVAALIFMLLVYGVNRGKIMHRVNRDHRHQEESYKEIFRVIVLVVSPIILSAFVYNVNAYINGYLFSDILGRRGGDATQIGILYAEYATYFMTIINIPLTLSSTAPTSMIPEVSSLYATGDIEATKACIDQTVQLSMVVSAPCAMGLAVLAQPIVFLLYGNSTGLAANLLILGSFSILAEWNVQYFQWCASGNRPAQNSCGNSSDCTGCRYYCGCSAAVYNKPWCICTADRDGGLFYCCMCIERPSDEEISSV